MAKTKAKPETRKLTSLTLDPNNARKHPKRNIEAIKASLRRWGQQTPIVVDKDGVVRKGNGTVIAARELGWKTIQVVETELLGAEAAAYAIADNRSGDLGEYDDEALAAQLKELDAELREAAGFNERELVSFLANPGDIEEDEVPTPKSTRTKPGDLWLLGKHRLLCGDSTKPEDVARLMDGRKGVLMNTDPPYGIAYSDGVRVAADRTHARQQRGRRWADQAIENDEVDGEKLQAFLEACIRAAVPHLTERAAYYLWHPMLTQGTFFAAAAAADILIHRQIIWVKPGLLFGFGDYHWKHELCFYGWRRGHRPEFYGERNQTTVWEIAHDEAKRAHPTQKPVDLFARPINNHTREGDVVYEPFCGSGSQLSAAEQLGRVCYAMEIDSGYCDVTVARWEALTGQKARKAK